MNNDLFHPLASSEDLSAQKLNDPFDYLPHPLVLQAAQQIEHRLGVMSRNDDAISKELEQGKMLGVLVARSGDGEIGFFAAFSGMMAGKTVVEYFVPPIYDLNSNYYRDEEQQISDMSRDIDSLRDSEEYLTLRTQRELLQAEAEHKISTRRTEIAAAKEQRAKRRLASSDETLLASLQRASQYEKAELRREQQRFGRELELLDEQLRVWQERIAKLESLRAKASQRLQRRMFESYRLVNGRGEWRSIYAIFKELYDSLPPSGTGECAAPKLLQYALCNDFTPIAMGEFWHGESPKGEVRHSGCFYGACRGKCEPILKFVLQGVDLMPSTNDESQSIDAELNILYDDEYIVVIDKPSGMLSVAGRRVTHSVESEVRRLFPTVSGAVMVHRLDQDTSGVMVVAKSAEVHKALQRQFAMRIMKKRYIAIVDGVPSMPSGEINLPLSANYEDRPRQKVDREDGKESHTTYQILSVDHQRNQSRLALYPHTGRTHQLRVHVSHRDGLDTPIVGDRLYGRSSSNGAPSRLMLHAEQIIFCHPITKEEMNISSPAPF